MPFDPQPRVGTDQRTAPPETPKIGLFADIPKWIWTVFISTWSLLFTLFVIFFTTNLAAPFVVTIAACSR